MKIESRTSRFERIFLDTPDIECIQRGFRFLEGPVWYARSERLLFSDIMGNALYTYNRDEGIRIFRPNSYLTNGNAIDTAGNLISCEHGTSRVSRTTGINGFGVPGEYEVLASHYDGKELNSPNDVIVRSDGLIFFTDPISGRQGRVGIPREPELDFSGVYRLDPETGDLACIIDDFAFPNGLCLSEEETQLYVNDTRRQHVRVFDLAADGSASKGRLFCELIQDGPGVADGMKFDAQGNLYVSAPRGIQVFAPDGELIGRLFTPEVAANFCWGGEDMRDLYLTATTGLYRVRVGVGGR